ncbi:MAG: deoxyribose-phosphate aldolase, partial [Chloroflexi bacterium]|nr:deoxyribose-phosphate aldolase [Chloroflexota bacterium]
MPPVTPAELAARIDQTLLAPTATPAQVQSLCEGARKHRFRAVCVSPSYVPLVVRHLEGSGVRVCTVVGFPLGSSTPAAKAYEAEEAVHAGATDIDMVINLGRLKVGHLDYVRDEISAVIRAAACVAEGIVIKVIIEACHLT